MESVVLCLYGQSQLYLRLLRVVRLLGVVSLAALILAPLCWLYIPSSAFDMVCDVAGKCWLSSTDSSQVRPRRPLGIGMMRLLLLLKNKMLKKKQKVIMIVTAIMMITMTMTTDDITAAIVTPSFCRQVIHFDRPVLPWNAVTVALAAAGVTLVQGAIFLEAVVGNSKGENDPLGKRPLVGPTEKNRSDRLLVVS
jgi:hypothetical protein